MANIMQQKNVRNHVHRNGFDLSRKSAFTAKVGELLPCFVMETLPGDHIDIDTQGFTRTTPIDSAAYTRIKEYVDFYYVPYHLLWDKFNSWIVQTGNPTYARSITENAGGFSTSPYITDKDLVEYYDALMLVERQAQSSSQSMNTNRGLDVCGLNRRQQSLKLMDLLGYGYVSNVFLKYPKASDVSVTPFSTPTALSPWRFLAYQKIYQDFYRDSQWETAKPWTYNLDYILQDSDTHINISSLITDLSQNGLNAKSIYNSPFDLRYANWQKDLVMGLQPSSQFGDVAFAGPLLGNLGVDVPFISSGDNTHVLSTRVSNSNPIGQIGNYSPNQFFHLSDVNNTSGISVFAIRQAEALQKWKEIAQSGSLDFKEQLKKHWNVDVSDEASDLCRWLGGNSNMIEIGEVTNTSLSTPQDSADIKGRGVGSHKGHIKFDAKHYGVVIGIYHAVPLLDYSSNMSFDRQLTKVKATDFAIPEMDSIGMQESFAFESIAFGFNQSLGSSSTNPMLGINKSVTGYAPRYIEYKTAVDKVFGGFAHGGYPSWVAPVDFDYLNFMLITNLREHGIVVNSYYSYILKKVCPFVLNPIFLAQVDSNFDGTFGNDQLLCNYYFDTKVVRNLSESGLPY